MMDSDPADPRYALTALAASVRWRVSECRYLFVLAEVGARGSPQGRAHRGPGHAAQRVRRHPFSAIQVALVGPQVVTTEASQSHPPEGGTMFNPRSSVRIQRSHAKKSD